MLVVVVAFAIAAMVLPNNTGIFGGTPPKQVELSQFEADVKKQLINTADWQQSTITGTYASSPKDKFEVNNVPEKETPAGNRILQEMDTAGVHY
ncbi:MAG TPA: ATP-dependent metallopeptidase FtsH/Yme1/Tma family protein, partial [Fimbriimonadaceae bacterium]|nr:ATP-dependent metallopeptidase FtsH/Yme1/Tma family protein [Fimbriimonadaceae bacterium]